MYVHLVSDTIPLAVSFYDIMRRHHHFVTVIPSGDRFIQLISGMPVTGIFCIDIELPALQVTAILQLLATQAPLLAKVAVILIGDITHVPAAERQLIARLALPIVTYPLQEDVLLATLAQLDKP